MARVLFVEPTAETQTTADGWLMPPLSENALTVLKRRYLKKNEGAIFTETPPEMFRRVARNIAQAERVFNKSADMNKWEKEFYNVMARLDFIPNSPTLMNAGRELQQLSACFVLPVDDSIDSIFEMVKHAALIHKSGGGTGFSFSRIRPRNDIVSTSHGFSSGPISFMKVFNEATEAINQGGFRRGANMAILNYNHPDIMEFITCKENEQQLNNFNISVGITEEFMKLAETNGEYDLLNPRSKKPVRRVNARQVFDLIVQEAWKSGEPGIVFLDRLNKDNPTPNIGAIESTNPCGEQPLLPYEACNLGSIHLGKMVNHQGIDFDHLRETVHTAVRFLDDVIEMNRFPLQKIDEMARGNRKIGLGVMGFADLLIKLGIPYNSDEALGVGEEVMKFISEEARKATQALAVERGPFPNFSGSTYDRRGELPMRNATTTTIAPTGTISIIAGASSGIEPLYAVCFTRTILDGTKMIEVNPVFEAIAKREGFYSKELMDKITRQNSIQHMVEIPPEIRRIFVTAHDIAPSWHIRMQAGFQKYTDNAVSKTVNFRHEATKEDIAEVYFLAYRTGCKGVTVYRDGCRQQQVLSTASTSASDQKKEGKSAGTLSAVPRPRPDLTRGTTRKLKTGCGTLYVTINCDEHNRPFELFSTMGKAGGCAASQAEAISRLISFALRSGADTKEIIKQLKGISCQSISWTRGGKILSCADAIARALEEAFGNNHAISQTSTTALVATKSASSRSKTTQRGACPECGGSLSYEEGCMRCYSCGYSECD